MKKTIYAKTLNPEYYDFRLYEEDAKSNEDIILVSNRNNPGFNEDLIREITYFADSYKGFDYEYCYHNDFEEYVNDMLPSAKKLASKELKEIKKVLDSYNQKGYSTWLNEVIQVCLSAIKGKKYEKTILKGYCQGDWTECWYPIDTPHEDIEFIEAWYYGTGTEILVHDEENEVHSPEDIEGFTFYTSSWKEEDLKNEIIKQFSPVTREGDEIEVVLWLYKDTTTIKRDNYQLAS